MTPVPPVTTLPLSSYQVSLTVKRAIGAFDMFFTWNVVTTSSFTFFVTGLVNWTSAAPLRGGVNFLPASTDLVGGVGVCAATAVLTKLAPTSVAARAKRARFI